MTRTFFAQKTRLNKKQFLFDIKRNIWFEVIAYIPGEGPPQEPLPFTKDLCGLPFHKSFLLTSTVPLAEEVKGFKDFKVITSISV